MVSTNIPKCEGSAYVYKGECPSYTEGRVRTAHYVLKCIAACHTGFAFGVSMEVLKNVLSRADPIPPTVSMPEGFESFRYTKQSLSKIIDNLCECKLAKEVLVVVAKGLHGGNVSEGDIVPGIKIKKYGISLLSDYDKFSSEFLQSSSGVFFKQKPLSYRKLQLVQERRVLECLSVLADRVSLLGKGIGFEDLYHEITTSPVKGLAFEDGTEYTLILHTELHECLRSLERLGHVEIHPTELFFGMKHTDMFYFITQQGRDALKVDFFGDDDISETSPPSTDEKKTEEGTNEEKEKEESSTTFFLSNLEGAILAYISRISCVLCQGNPVLVGCFKEGKFGMYFLHKMCDEDEAKQHGLPTITSFNNSEVSEALQKLHRLELIKPMNSTSSASENESASPLDRFWTATEKGAFIESCTSKMRKEDIKEKKFTFWSATGITSTGGGRSEGEKQKQQPKADESKNTKEEENEEDTSSTELRTKLEINILACLNRGPFELFQRLGIMEPCFKAGEFGRYFLDQQTKEEEAEASGLPLLDPFTEKDIEAALKNLKEMRLIEPQGQEKKCILDNSWELTENGKVTDLFLCISKKLAEENCCPTASQATTKEEEGEAKKEESSPLGSTPPTPEVEVIRKKVRLYKIRRGEDSDDDHDEKAFLDFCAFMQEAVGDWLKDDEEEGEAKKGEGDTQELGMVTPVERHILAHLKKWKNPEEGCAPSMPFIKRICDGISVDICPKGKPTCEDIEEILKQLQKRGLAEENKYFKHEKPSLWNITKKGEEVLLQQQNLEKPPVSSSILESKGLDDQRREDSRRQKILEILDRHRADDGTWCDANDELVLVEMLNKNTRPPMGTDVKEVENDLLSLQWRGCVEKGSFLLPSGQIKPVWKITAKGRDRLRKKSCFAKVEEYRKRDEALEVAIQELLYWQSAEDGFEPHSYKKNDIVDALLHHTPSLNSISFHSADVEMILNSLLERNIVELESDQRYKIHPGLYKYKAAEAHGKMPSEFNKENVFAILQSLENTVAGFSAHTVLKIARNILVKKWGRALSRDDYILLKRHFYYALRSEWITEHSKFFNNYRITNVGKSCLADITPKASPEVKMEIEDNNNDTTTMMSPKHYKYVPALLRIFTAKALVECGKDKFCKLLELMKRHMPYEREQQVRAALSWFANHEWLTTVDNNDFGECWRLTADQTVKFQKLTAYLERRAKAVLILPETYHGCVPALLELFKNGSIEEPKDDKEHCYITSILKDKHLPHCHLSHSLKSEFISYLFHNKWLVECRKAGNPAHYCMISEKRKEELEKVAARVKQNMEYNDEGNGDDVDLPLLFEEKYLTYLPELLQVLQKETVYTVAYTKIGEALYDLVQAKCPTEPAAKVADFIRYINEHQLIIPAYCFQTDKEYWMVNEKHRVLLESIAKTEMERRSKEAETALLTQSPPNVQPTQTPRRVLYVDLDQQNRDTPQKVIANFDGEVYGFCSQDVGAEKKFGKMKITIAPEGYSSIFLLQKHAYDLARDAAPGSLEVFFISKNSTFEKGLLKLIQDGGNLARQYDSAEALSRALRIRQNGGVDVVIPPWRL